MFVNLPSRIRCFSRLMSTAIPFALLMLGSYPIDAADINANMAKNESPVVLEAVLSEVIFPEKNATDGSPDIDGVPGPKSETDDVGQTGETRLA